MKNKKNLVFCLALGFSILSNAMPLPPIKTYELTDLQRVISNSDQCKPLYKALKQATKSPLILQFSGQSGSDKFFVADQTATLASHNYTIINQEVNGSLVRRIGMGSFLLDNQKVDYVIEVAADTSQPDFQYVYPVILSADHAHCYYTALVRPDTKTVETFKKNVQAGNASQKTDLYTRP